MKFIQIAPIRCRKRKEAVSPVFPAAAAASGGEQNSLPDRLL
jgi:hypothetical protein